MLFHHQPTLSNPVTPQAISRMMSNPEPDPSSPLDIVVQLFDLKTCRKELKFSIYDGTSSIEAVFLGIPNRCPRINSLQNFAFIRITDYRVKNITGKSKKYVVVKNCEAVSPSQRSLVKLRPYVTLQECVSPSAIPSILSEKPLSTINVQILDVKTTENNICMFTASDGRKKIRAMINFNFVPENCKTNSIKNLSLITILSYSLEVIPGKSARFLIIFNFKPLPSSICWEVKPRDLKTVIRVKLNGNSSGAKYEAPHFDSAEYEMYTSMKRVAIVYDQSMLNHSHPTMSIYYEKPDRVSAIWDRLVSLKITDRCFVLDGESADVLDVLRVHSKEHVDWVKWLSSIRKTISLKQKSKIEADSDIFFNDHTTEAAFLAAGCAVKAAERVASGAFDASVAIIRPPGHHAGPDEAMGFCFLNNVSVAASYLLARPDLGIKKILICDWDVHAGNGTQNIFYNDRRVLFFSVHRFDNATFYPKKEEGGCDFVGEGLGAGFNINVPWKHHDCSDSDYLYVWNNILLPVIREFTPDIIFISAGFDAAEGDSMGGCQVTPNGYATLLKKLMKFAEGKIVLILEGGYNPSANAASMEACMEALLAEKPTDESLVMPPPSDDVVDVTLQVCSRLKNYWPCLVPAE